MYVFSLRAIIIGRLHNLKTSVNGEDRPFGTIRDTEITRILSCDRRWEKECGGFLPRNNREREARDKVLVEIIRRFETLGLPLSHDPNSNPPPVPGSGLPSLSHTRGITDSTEIPTRNILRGLRIHNVDTLIRIYTNTCRYQAGINSCVCVCVCSEVRPRLRSCWD